MQNEQQQIKVNVDPNVYFITMVNMMFNEENFNFLVTSGTQGRQFAVSPKHAKRINMLLEKQLAEYEKKFGKIDTKLPEAPKQSQEETKIGF